MKKNTILSIAGSLLFFVGSLHSTAADFYVTVDYFSLLPNPVYIKSGDVVYWVEDNHSDLGPYMITGGWGTIVTPYGIQFGVAPGTYNYSAESAFGGGSWSGSVVVQMNFPPSVSITSPTNGAAFTAPGAFSFEADASDPNANDIMDVEFWVNDALVDDVYSAPYVTTVTNLAPGTYTLKAIAWDNSFITATNSITVNIMNPAPITLGSATWSGNQLVFQVNGLTAGKTNVLECSSNLFDWVPVQTNVSDGTSLGFTNAPESRAQFYRIMQLQ